MGPLRCKNGLNVGHLATKVVALMKAGYASPNNGSHLNERHGRRLQDSLTEKRGDMFIET